MLIDAHLHLRQLGSAIELESVVRSARSFGVVAGITCCLNIDDWHATQELVAAHEHALVWLSRSNFSRDWDALLAGEAFGVFGSVGFHPMGVASAWLSDEGEILRDRVDADCAALSELVRNCGDRIWAIGETGLDLSRQALAHSCVLGRDRLLEVQELAFAACLREASAAGLPVVIHVRNAWDRVLRRLERFRQEEGGVGGLIHCFPGAPEEFGRLTRLGFMASFGGVVTHPDALRMRAAVRECPSDCLLLETDSPDLAPMRADGSVAEFNQPSELKSIIQNVARLRGVLEDDVVKLATVNAHRFLRLSQPS